MLWVFHSSHGVWADFLATMRYSIKVVRGSIHKDRSLRMLLPALLAGVWLKRRGELRLRSPLVFGIVAVIWIPVWMKIIGRFPT